MAYNESIPTVAGSAELITTEDDVASLDIEYRRELPKWDLFDALCGGTCAMRDAGQRYLPMEPAEEKQQYELRLSRSFLYCAFKNTVDRFTSKPFSRPVSLQGTVPAQLKDIEKDADLTGNNLTVFARDLFKAAITYKNTYVLVDLPVMPAGGTAADEQKPEFRPAFVHIRPRQLIGRRYGRDGELEVIRIHERRVVPKGNYGEEECDFIRVVTRTSWQLYKKRVTQEGQATKIEWVFVMGGLHSFGAVPLFKFEVGDEPPLEDLAHLNVAHWQSMSDQRNYLRFIRIGILFGAGITVEEREKGLVIGPNRMYTAENPEATLGYVEHTGQAVGAGRNDLKDLEERMEIMGLQPMVQKAGVTTATGRVLDESKANSSIQAWTRGLENFIQTLYEAAAKWRSVKLPTDFRIDIFNDFGISPRATEDLQILLESWQVNAISHRTLLEQYKRRGIVSEVMVIDDEIQATKDEAPKILTDPFKAKGADPTNPGNGKAMA